MANSVLRFTKVWRLFLHSLLGGNPARLSISPSPSLPFSFPLFFFFLLFSLSLFFSFSLSPFLSVSPSLLLSFSPSCLLSFSPSFLLPVSLSLSLSSFAPHLSPYGAPGSSLGVESVGPRGGERPGDLPDATAATDALPTADVVAWHAFEACKNGFDKLLVALSGLDGAVSATLQGVPTDISLASAVISSGDLLEFAGMTLQAMHKIKPYDDWVKEAHTRITLLVDIGLCHAEVDVSKRAMAWSDVWVRHGAVVNVGTDTCCSGEIVALAQKVQRMPLKAAIVKSLEDGIKAISAAGAEYSTQLESIANTLVEWRGSLPEVCVWWWRCVCVGGLN